MPIEIDIGHVARLARLELTEDELALYEGQLEDIIEHAGRVSALDTDQVPPTSHPLPMTDNFRPDAVEGCLDREEVLGQAPDRHGSHIRVPPVLGSE